MAPKAKPTTPAKAAPSFTKAKPPARVKDPTLTREDAKSLADLVSSEEWVSDGIVYSEPREAHNATTGYRSALDAYGLIPDGRTLGGRVTPNQDGDGHRLYLTWKQRRGGGSES